MAQTDAQPRYCPNCGGPNPEVSARACRFCDTGLVPVGVPDPRRTVRCSACATAVSEGASFCDKCGHAMARIPVDAIPHACPGCSTSPMETFGLSPCSGRPSGTLVFGCGKCGGVWLDTASLKALLDAAAHQAQEDPRRDPASARQRRMASTTVVYRRCAVCDHYMGRRNFARISGVVVDECRAHGSFFDAGELEDVLAFVRSGGLALAKQRDAQARARETRHLERPHPVAAALMSPVDHHLGAADVSLVSAFLSWAIRWIMGR